MRRPPVLELLVFYLLYVATGGLSQSLAIIPRVSITFWPPAGIFLATLILSPRLRWPWWTAAGCAAELTCNLVWFHNPPSLAFRRMHWRPARAPGCFSDGDRSPLGSTN